MIKFIWFGLICCSAANGVIWYSEEIPDVWMLLVIFLCVVLVLVHRYYTEKWCNDKNDENHRDYDVDHFPLFVNSLFISLIFTVIACIFSTSCAIAGLTATIFFVVASIREAMYTWNRGSLYWPPFFILEISWNKNK